MKKPYVLLIAGIDPCGAAGLLADTQTCQQLGVSTGAIVTAVTAQNHQAVHAIEVISAEHLDSQLRALTSDHVTDAVKIGMLGSPEANQKIIHFLAHYRGPVVLDPVFTSTSGSSLFSSGLKQHLLDLQQLCPFVDVLTPNVVEAETLLNRPLCSYKDIEKGAHDLLALGAKSILLKGGHVQDRLFSQDYWTNGCESFWLASPRFPLKNYRGTGCVLSSAMTACLASGYSIKDALVIASMYTHRGIRLAQSADQHTAVLYHGGWPEEEIDLPSLSPTPLYQQRDYFPACSPIGLYPVVDSSDWIEKLLPLGVRTIQLRIKDNTSQLESEIRKSIALAKKYNAKLFINDHWELALQWGAGGIHLGQEDIQNADIERIFRSNTYLGISTHSYFEVARAHTLHPSYMAYGPIYPTTSKIMPFPPQGIARLQRLQRTLRYPVVAIGGINGETLPDVLSTGVTGIALISAITSASNPIVATQYLLELVNKFSQPIEANHV